MLKFDITTVYQPRRCKKCGTQVSDRNRSGLCGRCRAAGFHRKLFAERREAGLCPYCGKHQIDPKYARCAECREKKRDYLRRCAE